MRTSMTYPIRFWSCVLACLLLYWFSTEAAADWCRYEKDIDLTLDLADSEVLAITAAAGDLDITGVAGSDKAVIHGKVCVSKEAWLEEADIEITAGRRAQIIVDLPDSNGWSLWGSTYAWMDLELEIPRTVALEIRDSSGDIVMQDVGAVQLQDSSGDIDIDRTFGAVSIRDSSGDIDVTGVDGDITIESDSSGDIDVEEVNGNFTIGVDSSGDIRARDIDGTVLVKKDSSGEIRARQIAQNFIVEVDSSGDINARDVGGDFRVLKDGSGDIHSIDIRGSVQLPD